MAPTRAAASAAGPAFLDGVDAAIDQLVQRSTRGLRPRRGAAPGRRRPDPSAGCYEAVIRTCGHRILRELDGEEMQVKNSNAFNDRVPGVMISSGHMRRGASSYRTTCTPTAFPMGRPPARSAPDCGLPPRPARSPAASTNFILADVDQSISGLAPEAPGAVQLRRHTVRHRLVQGGRRPGLHRRDDRRDDQGTARCRRRLRPRSRTVHRPLQHPHRRRPRPARHGIVYRVTCYPAAF